MNKLTRYRAYELVRVEARTILKAPAPGIMVVLATDAERVVKGYHKVFSTMGYRKSCTCTKCRKTRRLLARMEE